MRVEDKNWDFEFHWHHPLTIASVAQKVQKCTFGTCNWDSSPAIRRARTGKHASKDLCPSFPSSKLKEFNRFFLITLEISQLVAPDFHFAVLELLSKTR